ncbi:exonuclease SbcCD subunit D [Candidatus Woesearchaeota archaeon]|nr:exonuclease SbcCD subunit D [Candidatus Woesearchaeota archaeon]
MKYVHIADCHLGSWREPKLREINKKAFISVIDFCIEKKIDFLLISGDLFNTALPPIESIKLAVQQLKKLKDNRIMVYAIAGSHDFSPSGKTILDVLESAGLIIDVSRGETIDGKLKLKFTEDLKTGIKITGLIGKKGGLEKNYYYNLIRDNLENEKGYKIFLFHTAISELKTKELSEMESMPISLLPKGFNYYAGGHVHVIDKKQFENYQNIIYPGPIWPNSFSEIEKLGKGGFVYVDNAKIEQMKIEPKQILSVNLNLDGKSPSEAEEAIINSIKEEAEEAIITIRLEGCLRKGKITEINFKKIFEKLYSLGAYFVMKNTSKLKTKEFEQIQISENSVEQIESKLINEHSGQSKIFEKEKEKEMIKQLFIQLSAEKQEGEKNPDFEKRITLSSDKLIMETS